MQHITDVLARAGIEGLNVQIYGKILFNNGFDTPTLLARLTKEKLEQIGIIKIGHVEAILEAAGASAAKAEETKPAREAPHKPPALDPQYLASDAPANKLSPTASGITSPSLRGAALKSPQGAASPMTPNSSRNRLEALKARISTGQSSPVSTSGREISHTEDDEDDVFYADAFSVFHARALEAAGNPWADRVFSVTKALQFSSALDSAMVTYASLQKSRLFRAKMGDIIVSGVQRCGQTPVLLALDALRRGAMNAHRADVVDRVEWIEAAYPQVEQTESRRLLKSHLTLRSLLSESAIPGKFHARAKDFKIICVLRDPLSIRRSWYDLAHQAFRHFNPNETWDFTADDWCKVPVANYRMSGVDTQADYDYESYLLEVIELTRAKHPNVEVVFYEDLLVHPVDFVRKLQEVTGLGDEKLASLVGTKLASDDPNHPMSASRERGASKGHMSITRTSTRAEHDGKGFMLSKRGDEYALPSLQWIDGRWDSIVRTRHKELLGYEDLYEQISGKKWPHGKHRRRT